MAQNDVKTSPFGQKWGCFNMLESESNPNIMIPNLIPNINKTFN